MWNRPGEALTDREEAPSQQNLRVPPGEQAKPECATTPGCAEAGRVLPRAAPGPRFASQQPRAEPSRQRRARPSGEAGRSFRPRGGSRGCPQRAEEWGEGRERKEGVGRHGDRSAVSAVKKEKEAKRREIALEIQRSYLL